MKNTGNSYSWQGMLIISVLMIIGIIILYFSIFFCIKNYEELNNYISYYGIGIIFSLFFIGVGIYTWILFIRNSIINPKKEILYLVSKEENLCTLIDKKGKKFYFEDNNYEIEKYYDVLKTHDYIHKIINISSNVFDIPIIKGSYWLNFYCIAGNFENIFLLPIVYVILMPGLFSFFFAKGFEKIIAIIFCLTPTYLIIYDLIYKIKKNKLKGNHEKVDDNKLKDSFIFFINIIKILVVSIVTIFLFIEFIEADKTGRLILSLFTSLSVCALGYTITDAFNNYVWMNIFKKSLIGLFLLYFFGFLIVFILLSIKDASYSNIIFTVPFWGLGIYLIYENFIKKL